MDYRSPNQSSSNESSPARSPTLPEHPAIPDLQQTSGVDALLGNLDINMSTTGAEGGEAALSKEEFMKLVSNLATSARFNSEQAQVNTNNLTALIQTLQGSNLGGPTRVEDPRFSQSTFKDLILKGSDEEKLESLISWENGVRRICDARGWPKDPSCTLTMLLSAIMSGFTTSAERLTQGVIPAACTSLEDFFIKVRTAALGTAVAEKAMSMFRNRRQREGEDINMFHSTLLTIFKIAFTGEARQKESQETLKSRFLAGLIDFSHVEKLVETKDMTSLTYDELRAHILQIQGRQEVTKSLALLRQGRTQDTGSAPTSLATPPLPTPIAAPPEPMDWQPVTAISRQRSTQQQQNQPTPWTAYNGARPRQPQWRLNPRTTWASPRANSNTYPSTPARASAGPTHNSLPPNRINQSYPSNPFRTVLRGPHPNEQRICYNCRQPGHIAIACPMPRQPRTRQQPVQFIDEHGRLFRQVEQGTMTRNTYDPPQPPTPLAPPTRNMQPPLPVRSSPAPVAQIEHVSPPHLPDARSDEQLTPEVFETSPHMPADWDISISNIVEGSFPGQAPPPKNAGPQ